MPGSSWCCCCVAACDGSGRGPVGPVDGAPAATARWPRPTWPCRRATSRWSSRPGARTCSSGSRAPEGSASRPRLTVLDPAGGSARGRGHPGVADGLPGEVARGRTPRDGAVDLVGGAPAGAHSNTRWSTWRGDAAGVRELPQPFATFGGWGAGALVSLVQTPSAPGRRRVVGERWRRARHRPVAPDGRALGAGLLGRHAAGQHGHRPGVGTRRHGRPRRRARRRLGDPARRAAASPSGRRSGGHPGPTARGRAPTCRATASLGEAHAAACDDAGRAPSWARSTGPCAGWTLAADGSVLGSRPARPRRGRARPAHGPAARGGEPTVVLASGGALRVLTVTATARWRRHPASATGPPARRAVRSAARTAHRRLRRPRGPRRRGPPGPPHHPLTARRPDRVVPPAERTAHSRR